MGGLRPGEGTPSWRQLLRISCRLANWFIPILYDIIWYYLRFKHGKAIGYKYIYIYVYVCVCVFLLLGDRVVVDGDDGPIAAWRNTVVWPALSLSLCMTCSDTNVDSICSGFDRKTPIPAEYDQNISEYDRICMSKYFWEDPYNLATVGWTWFRKTVWGVWKTQRTGRTTLVEFACCFSNTPWDR